MLQRVRELAVQAQSDTNSSSDKSFLQGEAEALFKEIDRVSSDTTYNNVAYLGSGAANLNIQVDTTTATLFRLLPTTLHQGISEPQILQLTSHRRRCGWC